MKIWKKLETLFAAVAFAEAGEHETAVRMVEESGRLDKCEKPIQQEGSVEYKGGLSKPVKA